jgi:hypothetical protein
MAFVTVQQAAALKGAAVPFAVLAELRFVSKTVRLWTGDGRIQIAGLTWDGTGNGATIASFPATAVAGTFVPFQLAAGDLGVRAITAASSGGITLGTSYGTGTVHLVAYRVLAQIPVSVANAAGVADTVSGLLPRMYDNSVPFLVWLPAATTTHTVQGQIVYAHG